MPPVGIGGGKFQPAEVIHVLPSLPAPVIPTTGIPDRPPKPPGGLQTSGGIGGVGLLHGGPLTPEVIDRISPFSHPTGTITINQTWKAYNFDRPTILWNPAPDDGVINLGFTYGYGVVPTTLVPGANAFAAFPSERSIGFISSPGVWWVRAASNNTLTLLVYDGFNPSVVAKFLDRGGCNYLNEANIAVASAVATTTILPANGGRSALTLQNVGAVNVRIAVGQPAAYLLTAGNGVRLTPNASITYAGDTLSRGTVLAILEAAGATTIEYLEFGNWL
jgi:hypothetical protein